MFGVIAAGRLPQSDGVEVAPGKFLINVHEADSVNHLVVFLTGSSPLPAGMGGSVYYSWPDPNAPQTWQYLGFISNEKPSAIFGLTKLRDSLVANGNEMNETWGDGMIANFAFNQIQVSHIAQIGISIELLTDIQQLQPASSQHLMENFASFTIKTAENLFNYVSSFAKNIPGTNEQIVPLSSVQSWYTNYMKRLEMNPNFWRT